MWDNLTCWQAANVGEVVMVNCPELFHDFMDPEDGEKKKEINSSFDLISLVFLKLISFSSIQPKSVQAYFFTFRDGEGQS